MSNTGVLAVAPLAQCTTADKRRGGRGGCWRLIDQRQSSDMHLPDRPVGASGVRHADEQRLRGARVFEMLRGVEQRG